MTFSYMPYWRAVDAKVEGASQRIQEDAMNFAKIVESLGLQIVRAIMLLIAFLPILWGLSSNVVIPFFKVFLFLIINALSNKKNQKDQDYTNYNHICHFIVTAVP